jgi:hypothetical protein
MNLRRHFHRLLYLILHHSTFKLLAEILVETLLFLHAVLLVVTLIIVEFVFGAGSLAKVVRVYYCSWFDDWCCWLHGFCW